MSEDPTKPQPSSGPGPEPAPAPAPAPRPALPAWKKALFAGMLIAVIALGAEGIMRVYYRARTGSWAMPDKYKDWQQVLYQPHPYVGYQVAPSIRFEQDGVVIETNALGFRGPELELPKPRGRVRIATLGGSTTFNTKVSGNAATWPARLAERARARGLDADYLNGGCPNYTTADTLANLAFRVLDAEPDLVVVYHSWNDLKCAQEPGFRSDYTHWRPIYHHREPGVIASVLGHSFIYANLARKARRRRASQELLEGGRQEDWVDMPEEAPRAFERNLRSIVALCRANGIEVALCTMATRESQHEKPASADFFSYYHPHFDPERLQDGMRRYADVVRAVAQADGTALIDAQKHMPLERDHEDVLFADTVHFTDVGTSVLADVMDRELARQGVWERLTARAHH